jgi:26S proteasome regulatory subunit N5
MEGRSGRASGGQLEQRVDLSAETLTRLSQAQALVAASSSNLNEALILLAAHEKKCRLGNDLTSLIKVCELSLQLCKDCGDEERLVATLNSLVSKRNQKTKAVSAMVQKAIPWVLRLESGAYLPLDVSSQEQKKIRDHLVVALRNITDGKIFLEAERARLTRAYAAIKASVHAVLFYNRTMFFNNSHFIPFCRKCKSIGTRR